MMYCFSMLGSENSQPRVMVIPDSYCKLTSEKKGVLESHQAHDKRG